MGTRFTRVTVVGDERQIDISLPADAPLATQIPAVLRLLSVPPAAPGVRWRLAGPEFGTLPPGGSLDDAGVLDGATLYLRHARDAPPPPFVDDVERSTADTVADTAPGWTGEHRRDGLAGLVCLVLVGCLALGLTTPAPMSWIAPAITVVIALGASALRGRGGWVAAGVVGPATIALLYGISAAPGSRSGSLAGTVPLSLLGPSLRWAGWLPTVVLAVSVALVVTAAARRSPGLLAGAATIGVAAGLAQVADLGGLPPARTAGLALLVAVVLLGLSGQVALGGAGLVPLMVADEKGTPVLRTAVRSAVRRGLAIADGLLWAAAAIAAPAVWVLLSSAHDRAATGWIGPALGGLGGLIFALRSRMFTRARHVVPPLVVAVTAGIAAAFGVPHWSAAQPSPVGIAVLATLLVLLTVLVLAGSISLSEVTGARVARLFERLELVCVLALVPALVMLFRVIPAVGRWWG